MKKQAFLYIFFITLLVSSASCEDSSSQHVLAAVKLPDGREIYLKREARGINGNNNVISISANENPCAEYNPDTDYCLCYGPQEVYYKVESDTLHLYLSSSITAPKNPKALIKIEEHIIHPTGRQEFERTYIGEGLTRLDLNVDESKTCG